VRETAKEILIEAVKVYGANCMLYFKQNDRDKLALVAAGLAQVFGEIPSDIKQIALYSHFDTTTND